MKLSLFIYSMHVLNASEEYGRSLDKDTYGNCLGHAVCEIKNRNLVRNGGVD